MQRISYDTDGHLALIGLARPEKRNAFDMTMLGELALAYTQFEEDTALRCAFVYAHGDHFTGGLDLADVGPKVAAGEPLFGAGHVDPLDLGSRRRTKPVVIAVRGYCLTIGVELALAADVRIAADDTKLSQIEVARGIYPFGGATLRFPAVAGVGDAMRWLLTGDFFDAAEALRMGIVSEVVPAAEVNDRGRALAERIAAQAPLAVQATRASVLAGITDGFDAEAARLESRATALFATEDAKEGMQSFLERRAGVFEGR